MQYKLGWLSLGVLVILSPFVVSQDPGHVHERQMRFRVIGQDASNARYSEIDQAKQWGITVADWKRYKVIMQGPRGHWSPNLDPLTVLGVHAQSDGERSRIADIQVNIEHQRLMQEMAYEKAYQQAQLRILSEQPMPFDEQEGKVRNSVSTVQNSLLHTENSLILGDRLLFFISLVDCNDCSKVTQQVLAKVAGRTDIRLDIYFVNSTVKDKEDIQRWAKKQTIAPEQLRNGVISLNYDMGTALKIGITHKDLPTLIRKRAGKYAKL